MDHTIRVIKDLYVMQTACFLNTRSRVIYVCDQVNQRIWSE